MRGILGPMNDAGFGQVLGLGHDLVDLKEFGRQLAMPQALGPEPSPYGLDDFPWNRVEILDDGRGRPSVNLESPVEARLYDSLPLTGGQVDRVQLCWHIALSHDGSVASAVVLLCRCV